MGYENSYSLSFRYETFGFEAKYGQFLQVKLLVSRLETLGLYSEKLSFQLVGCQQGYLHKTAETDTFRTKSVCFGIKVLYSGADLRSDTLFPFSDCCYIGNISFEERVTVLVFAHYPAGSINQ